MTSIPLYVKGAGVGKGFNVNIPMIQGDGNDAYSYAINHYVLPTVKAFQPTMIFIACGFDALAGDPYASMGLTPVWFAWLAARLKEAEIAPVVFNLEGGYGPRQCGVAAGKVIDGLSGVASSDEYVDDMGIAADPVEDRGAFGVAYPVEPISRSFIDMTYVLYCVPLSASGVGFGCSSLLFYFLLFCCRFVYAAASC